MTSPSHHTVGNLQKGRPQGTSLLGQGNRVLILALKESGTWRSIRTVRALSAVILSPPTVTPAKAGVQGGCGWGVPASNRLPAKKTRLPCLRGNLRHVGATHVVAPLNPPVQRCPPANSRLPFSSTAESRRPSPLGEGPGPLDCSLSRRERVRVRAFSLSAANWQISRPSPRPSRQSTN